jgi:flap endonuclease-1
MIDLEKTLEALDLTREGLVELAILVGTDFNEGVPGVGPRTALKLLKKHGGLEAVLEERGLRVPNAGELKGLFLEPAVAHVEPPRWGPVDDTRVKEYLCGRFGFGESGVEKALGSFARHRSAMAQKSLDRWS